MDSFLTPLLPLSLEPVVLVPSRLDLVLGRVLGVRDGGHPRLHHVPHGGGRAVVEEVLEIGEMLFCLGWWQWRLFLDMAGYAAAPIRPERYCHSGEAGGMKMTRYYGSLL